MALMQVIPARGIRKLSQVASIAIRPAMLALSGPAMALGGFGDHVEVFVDGVHLRIELVPSDGGARAFRFYTRNTKPSNCGRALSAKSLHRVAGWNVDAVCGVYRVHPRDGGGLRIDVVRSQRLDLPSEESDAPVAGKPRRQAVEGVRP